MFRTVSWVALHAWVINIFLLRQFMVLDYIELYGQRLGVIRAISKLFEAFQNLRRWFAHERLHLVRHGMLCKGVESHHTSMNFWKRKDRIYCKVKILTFLGSWYLKISDDEFSWSSACWITGLFRLYQLLLKVSVIRKRAFVK